MSLAEEERIVPTAARAPLRPPRRRAPPPPSRAAPADAAPPQAAQARASARSRCSASRCAVLLAGAAYGIYYALVLNHYESTDNAYVQGNVVQVTPQVVGHRRRDQRRRHRLRQGRPVAGQARPGRRAGRARAGRGAARADGARGAHPVRQQRLAEGADRGPRGRRRARAERRRCAPRTTSPGARRWSRTGAVGQEEFNHVTAQLAAAKSGARGGAVGGRGGARAARLEPVADREHLGRAASERAARRGRACARRTSRCAAPSWSRRSTATSPGAASSSASASRPARRCCRWSR